MNESIDPECGLLLPGWKPLHLFLSFLEIEHSSTRRAETSNIARDCFISFPYYLVEEKIVRKNLWGLSCKNQCITNSYSRSQQEHRALANRFVGFCAPMAVGCIFFLIVVVLLTVASGSKKTNTREDRPSVLPKYSTVMENIELAIMIEP